MFAFEEHCGLICNGVAGTQADPHGGAGGWLFGDGGAGWTSTVSGVTGGDGGDAGGFGNGGDGGAGGLGADGGNSSLLWGNGGDGGDGGTGSAGDAALPNVFPVGAPDSGVGGLSAGAADLGGNDGDGGAGGVNGCGTINLVGDVQDGGDGGAGGLGGRLPLIDLNNADSAQLDLASTIKVAADRFAAVGVEITNPDGQLIGPFNAWLYDPAVSSSALDFANPASQDSGLSKAIQEIVTFSVGGLWGSDYEVYPHEITARLAGVPENAITALAGGEAPVGLTGNELIAAQFVQELVQTHHVDNETYHAVEAAFGQDGLVAIVNLAGAYLYTSALLNTFEVPAPTTD